MKDLSLRCGLEGQSLLEPLVHLRAHHLFLSLPLLLRTMATQSTKPKGIWEMTKVELLERARSLGCLVHPTWTVGEIRQVVSEKQRQLTGEDSVPKGLSSMTLAQLKKTCAELQLAMPSNPTTGQLLRLIRDQTQAPVTQSSLSDDIGGDSFRKYRNHIFVGRWRKPSATGTMPRPT